jgi:hypothetical protein
MNIYKKQTRYLKNIISSLNKGFSLVEIIIASSIATFLIVTIVGIVMMLNSAFQKLNNSALNIFNISRLTGLVSNDILNPDLFPHHMLNPVAEQSTDCYVLKNNEITFFADHGKVEYKISDSTSDLKTFTITKKDEKYRFRLLKSFNINYYDSRDFETKDLTNFPSYCILNFTFYDNRKVSMKMKL